MKLLVVEDDRMLSELIRRALVEDGYDVDVALDGEQAEALASVSAYDAIVLDIVLPHKSGLDLVEELRREGRMTPILMLTGRRGTSDVVRGLDMGADDYLTKPFDFDELKARVRALMRRAGSLRNDRVDVGALVVDRLRRQATVGERQLRMTPKEFALLEYLALHAESVVSRTELLEEVWDLHFDPGSNVVDVHVARLRRKLRQAGAGLRLDTVRGVGFVLTVGEDAGNDGDGPP